MDDMYSVLSAMLDDEPVDAGMLAAALETREGRELLIDLVALRRLVQAPMTAPVVPRRRPAWRLLAAAAIVLAAITGYAAGQREADDRAGTIAAVPAATRVLDTTGTWQPLPRGGVQ
jgi:hypothetical protein